MNSKRKDDEKHEKNEDIYAEKYIEEIKGRI